MIGDISASNMHDGRWMFARLIVEPSAENRGHAQVEIAAIRTCSAADAVAIVDWLHERAAGYPSLRKFEGGALWPPYVPQLFAATCCKCGKVDYHAKPVTGVYFCGYGCT